MSVELVLWEGKQAFGGLTMRQLPFRERVASTLETVELAGLMVGLRRIETKEVDKKVEDQLGKLVRVMPYRKTDIISELPYFMPFNVLRKHGVMFNRGLDGHAANEENRMAVVMTPGLAGSKSTFSLMSNRLRKEGYLPIITEVCSPNTSHPNEVLEKIGNAVNDGYKETGKKVHLLGGSLGGMLSVIYASRKPFKINGITTLGTPFQIPVEVSPGIYAILLQMAHKHGIEAIIDVIQEAIAARLPSHIPVVSIRAAKGKILNEQSCVKAGAENREVNTEHLAMPYSPDVFKVVLETLKGKQN